MSLSFKLKNISLRVISFSFSLLLLLLLIILFGIKTINSYELATFEDFLELNYLKHAIVVVAPAPHAKSNFKSGEEADFEYYKKLLQNYRVQFFVANTCTTPINNTKENFNMLFYYESPRVGIFVSLKHVGEQQFHALHECVFAVASRDNYFNSSQAWFIVMPENKDIQESLEVKFAGYNINIDADITLAKRQVLDNDCLELYDVYKVNHAELTPLLIQRKGQWCRQTGFNLIPEFQKSRVQRRRDFGNTKFWTSTALLEKPNDLLELTYLANDQTNLQLDPMQRKTYKLLQPMEQMFNMSFNIRFSNTWGLEFANGSWSGVIGHLLTHESEFTICPLRFTLDRMGVIQFSHELHTQFIHFLLRHPRHNDLRNIFFEPLSEQVWWCVLALIMVALALLMLHVKHERREANAIHMRQQRKREGQKEPSVPVTVEHSFDFIWFTLLETVLMQGPSTDVFRLMSTRLMILATCVFSYMLLQFYGAFIVGSLLSDTPRTIVDLQSLYASNLEVGMEDVSYNYLIFENTTKQLVRDTYTQRICRKTPHNIFSIQEGAERIKAGGFAFHSAVDRMYRILIELLDEREFCDLQEIIFSPPYTSALGLRKGSPLREHFAFTVLHMRATGLMQYNDRRWDVPKLDCSFIREQEVNVDLEHFAPALITLAVAMVGSTFIFLLELLSVRLGGSRRRRCKC